MTDELYDKWMNNYKNQVDSYSQETKNNIERVAQEMRNKLDQYQAQTANNPWLTKSTKAAMDSSSLQDLYNRLSPNKNICPNCKKEIEGDAAYRIHCIECNRNQWLKSPQESIDKKTVKPIKDLENLIDGLYE